MSKKKMIGMITIAALMAGLVAMPVMAASKQKSIKNVNITIKSQIVPESRHGSEQIEIETTGKGYYYDEYEIENFGSTWEVNERPEIVIYLRTEDDYSFAGMAYASQVKITGGQLAATKAISKSKEGGTYFCLLKVRVQLPSLSEYVGDFAEDETVELTNNGFAVWKPVMGAGSYAVMIYRDGNPVGVTERFTNETNYNLKDEITRPASYQVKVRPINGENTSNKGKWLESNIVSYNADQVKAIRAGEAGGLPVSGEWKSDTTGWWYQHSDGTYTKNAWEEIDGKWYIFDENGYMRTGWIDWNGEKYYCDNSGAMLKNTTTPDGYILDYDGRIKND